MARSEKLRAEELAESILKALEELESGKFPIILREIKSYSCERTWVKNRVGAKYYYVYLKGTVYPFSIYIPEELTVICEVIQAVRTKAILKESVREELKEKLKKALVVLQLSKLTK